MSHEKSHSVLRTSVNRRKLIGLAGGTAVAVALSGPVRTGLTQDSTPTVESNDDGPLIPLPAFADVPYTESGDPMHLLDIHLPKGAGRVPMPLVIWIHGGGWIGGDKRRVGVSYLLEDGFAIASINYRLMPAALPPAQIQDANSAVGFLWENADTYGFDRERFVLGGSSAGGRSTGLAGLSLNNDVTEFNPPADVRFAALLDFFGGIDSVGVARTRRQSRRIADIPHADRVRIKALIDTMKYVDGDDPPTLIVHGDQDRIVPVEESVELAAALNSAGASVQLERFPDRGHGIRNFQDDAARAVVRDFLATHLD